MDRKQLTASIAGVALVAASLFGAVAAAQGSGDITVSDAPQVVSESAPAYEAVPLAVSLDQPGSALAGEYEAGAHEENEYEQDEEYEEYEDHEDEEYEEYEDHEDHEDEDHEDEDHEDEDHEDEEHDDD